MTGHRLWSVNSRQLAAVFLAVVVPPAVTLVWLGLQLLQQDRALLAQRELESRQAASQTIVRSLEQFLREAPGAVRFTISESGVRADPAAGLLWLPVAPRLQESGSAPFIETEAIEYQANAQGALSRYEELARSPDAGVRAGVLVRLARVYRRERQWDRAVAAYRKLALLTRTAIDGVPADLLARTAICSVFEESDRKSQLDREAAALESDFLAGHWALDRSAWELTAGKLEQWMGRALPVAPDRRVLSALGDWLSEQRAALAPERVIVLENTQIITLLSQRSGADLTVLAVMPSVAQEWVARAIRGTPIAASHVKLLADSAVPLEPGALRLLSTDTGLPGRWF